MRPAFDPMHDPASDLATRPGRSLLRKLNPMRVNASKLIDITMGLGGDGVRPIAENLDQLHRRHPELVSGSIAQRKPYG
jgi:hypothetical protein